MFSKIDLKSRYHKLKIKEEDIPKITFRTKYGHYEFLLMSFGLTNTPVAFMDIMNRVFKDYLKYLCLHSQSRERHVEHLKTILSILREKKLCAKFKKCEFWLEKVTFLVM